MRKLKLKIFSFIDEVIEYKHELRFEIDATKRSIDALFLSMFQENERFINYTSRIKEDDSLKEKIIRQNYAKRFDTPAQMFDCMSDIIGCRLECRFIDDEHALYEQLFRYFSIPSTEGYYRADRDPRIELKLSEKQPLIQKNGFHSYRIDGRFLGNRVLNFELQIKSIVNLFWNEIDHKILYKNYNYVVSETFVREIMNSIKGNLSVIDKQLQMVYDHLKNLESVGLTATQAQLRTMVGRLLQDAFIVRLREEDGLIVDFRKPMDLITDYLFAKVRYESRESFAVEFVRLMDSALSLDYQALQFGEMILFSEPPHYHNEETAKIGRCLEEEMNSGLPWNIIVRIVFSLHPEVDRQTEFRTFVDYLYFRVIQVIREVLSEYPLSKKEQDRLADELSELAIEAMIGDFQPVYFIEEGIEWIRERLRMEIDWWQSGEQTKENGWAHFTEYLREELPGGRKNEAFD